MVSRLIDGCRRFNEIHRGLPKMSATLLSQRLEQLEHAGLIERRPLASGRGHEYLLTEAGEELGPIVMDMAIWGQRFAREMVLDDLDPAFLAWSMHTRLDTGAMPDCRTVMEFAFTGTPTEFRRFWLVHEGGVVDMCLKHPGFEVDIEVRADIRRFVEAWRGFRDLRGEIEAGRIRVDGPTDLRRALPDWLKLSALAPYKRVRNVNARRGSKKAEDAAA